jgi:glycine cleavage system H lipoate-binding protein
MVLILGEPWDMTLPEVGLKLVKDTDVFTSISGWKIFADFYSPVTGEIVLVNEGLRPYLRGDKLLPIVYSAFSHGWIIAVRLSKPEEINDLLTPQGYLERLGKK